MEKSQPVQKSSKKSRPTMRDVANELNVSVMTVSKVINGQDDISEETKTKVWDTISKVGYVPNIMASNLRRKQSNMIALVLSDLSQPYFQEVIYGYESILSASGYNIFVFNSFENREKELELLKQISTLNVAGIIIDIAQNPENSISYLRSMHMPYVLSNRYVDLDKDCYVIADNVQAGYIATLHLLSRKPSSPVLFISEGEVSPSQDRYKGYLKALKEAGIEPADKFVFGKHHGLEEAYEEGKTICRTFKPPFSVFCATDRIAIGFMRAVTEANYLIPEDVAVIGVDDISLSAYIVPSLTTISIPKEEIGRRSAKKLLSLIKYGKVDEPREVLEPTLIVRQTT